MAALCPASVPSARSRRPKSNGCSPCSIMPSSKAIRSRPRCGSRSRRCWSRPISLFLVEQTPEQGGFYRIGQFELATRLAYFIWAAPPDDELLALAEAGRLHDDGVIREQTQRLLKDPKFARAGPQFCPPMAGARRRWAPRSSPTPRVFPTSTSS